MLIQTPWTTARPITRPITEPQVMNNDQKNALVESNSTDISAIMDSLPPLPNGIVSLTISQFDSRPAQFSKSKWTGKPCNKV